MKKDKEKLRKNIRKNKPAEEKDQLNLIFHKGDLKKQVFTDSLEARHILVEPFKLIIPNIRPIRVNNYPDNSFV